MSAPTLDTHQPPEDAPLSSCINCGRSTRPPHTTVAMYPGTTRSAGGICDTCYRRQRTYGDMNTNRSPRRRADLLEDIDWMAETGESLRGAAVRLDVTYSYLVGILSKTGRIAMRDRMGARDERVA